MPCGILTLMDAATAKSNVKVTVNTVDHNGETAVHGAAIYKVGIPSSQREGMYETNVRGTERVLDVAIEAGVPKIVYVSTVNVFGNTHGHVVDETYRRDLREGFRSWYDETKYGAHEVAEQRIARGAPVIIVEPSQVYGPADHSGFGEQLALHHRVLDVGELAGRQGDVGAIRPDRLQLAQIGHDLVEVVERV